MKEIRCHDKFELIYNGKMGKYLPVILDVLNSVCKVAVLNICDGVDVITED